MAANTAILEQINQVTAERARLYGLADRGAAHASNRLRIAEISQELSNLWDDRRRERTGHLDGIDLLIDQEYRRIYGSAYDEVVRPPAVAEAEDGVPTLMAA